MRPPFPELFPEQEVNIVQITDRPNEKRALVKLSFMSN